MYKVFLLSRERQRENRLRKAVCYSTLATSTLIIIIFRNVEIFKIIKIWRDFFCEEIILEYPGTFHMKIFNMKILKQNNYSTLKCWTCHGTIVNCLSWGPKFWALFTRCYIKLPVNLDEMMPNILPLAICIHKNLWEMMLLERVDGPWEMMAWHATSLMPSMICCGLSMGTTEFGESLWQLVWSYRMESLESSY
jgi:hypothetical protein